MSGAFRLSQRDFEKWYSLTHSAPDLIKKAVYGMPAMYRDSISGADLVANPGCYATSVILALAPLKGLVCGEASIVATSGNSGARREIERESDEITYSYGKKHKHVPEMHKYSGFNVNFTPVVLRSVFKGINANIRIKLSEALCFLPDDLAAQALEDRLRSAYRPDDLVFVESDTESKVWGTRDVNGTNNMIIKVGVDDGNTYICSMLDNLIKGAAGQAVENMNIMLGMPRLKGITGGI
jgi:N-acetyl-gamma-glutamyl-phosphate reductase